MSSTFINVRDFGAIGDGNSHPLSDVYSTLSDAQGKYPHAISLNDELDWAAIQGAVDVAEGRSVLLPAGTYKITAPIICLTDNSETYRNGMKLIGEGMNNTIIIANIPNGSAIKFDVSNLSGWKYTRDSMIANLQIAMSAASINTDGIYLTAAWFVKIHNVFINGMSGRGINVPFRLDINSYISSNVVPNFELSLSDPWQCYNLDLFQCWIQGCSGWGIYFGGGQSPGIWSMRQSTISGNTGGGLFTSAGQFELVGNLIVGNGKYRREGGMKIQGVEGPPMVPLLLQNEFDTNYNYHLAVNRAQGLIARQNRFLHSTYDAERGGNTVLSGGYMRPQVGVSLGNSVLKTEARNCIFERNYHRSTPTSNVLVEHFVSAGFSAGEFYCSENYINDLFYVGMNSLGHKKFVGFSPSDFCMLITEEQLLANAPLAPVVSAKTGSSQSIGLQDTIIIFDSENADPHGLYDIGSGAFSCKHRGYLEVSFVISIDGLAAGNIVNLKIKKNGFSIADKVMVASGSSSESFDISSLFPVSTNDRIIFTANQNSGPKKLSSVPQRNRLYIHGLW